MAEIPAGSKLVFIDADVPTRELKSSRSNSKTEVYTIEDIAETVGGGGSDYTETIVKISSAQILSMGTSPIELLPAPGVWKYYDIEKIVLEFSNGTQNYDMTGIGFISIDGSAISNFIEGSFITTSNKKAIVIQGTSTAGTGSELYSSILEQPIILTTNSGDNPTLGDGKLRVKIYHKTITFGA